MSTPPSKPLKIRYNNGAITATAIHCGHYMSSYLNAISGLTNEQRLREEDPFTDKWTDIVQIVYVQYIRVLNLISIEHLKVQFTKSPKMYGVKCLVR